MTLVRAASGAQRLLMPSRQRPGQSSLTATLFIGDIMGKYFLAWLLGVPGILLVLLYIFFH